MTTAGDPIPCFRCGTCCIAPDISTLGKPVNVRCVHLRDDRRCAIYEERPPVCRDYRPDEICLALRQLPPEARVAYYLAVYGLEAEAGVASEPAAEGESNPL